MRGPTRTPAKWKENLGVWKSQLRGRARQRKAELLLTGGGPLNSRPLSAFEERALSTFGNAAVDGLAKVRQLGIEAPASPQLITPTPSPPVSSTWTSSPAVSPGTISPPVVCLGAVSPPVDSPGWLSPPVDSPGWPSHQQAQRATLAQRATTADIMDLVMKSMEKRDARRNRPSRLKSSQRQR